MNFLIVARNTWDENAMSFVFLERTSCVTTELWKATSERSNWWWEKSWENEKTAERLALTFTSQFSPTAYWYLLLFNNIELLIHDFNPNNAIISGRRRSPSLHKVRRCISSARTWDSSWDTPPIRWAVLFKVVQCSGHIVHTAARN